MNSIHTQNLIEIMGYSFVAFLIGIFCYPAFIRFIQRYKLTQKIRTDDITGKKAKLFAALHAHKSGTPSMGGAVIILAVLSTIIFSRLLAYLGIIDHSLLNRGETYLPILTLFGVGCLGLLDDYLNITEKSNQKGLSSRVKFWSLFGFALIGALWFVFKLEYGITYPIHVPGVGDFNIGYWYLPLFVFIIVGVSNAVNITDGLDGLAGGLLSIAYGTFAVIAYFYGLPILATFCAVITASITSFLWYNVPPAKIYMGDTGSLALGATLGVIAMLTNAIFILAIIGMIFVIETLSVMLQLFWKKYFKRKLFLIAPIHHHFEAKGWSETQIVMRFWIVGAIFGVLGLFIGLFGMGKSGF